MAACRRTSWWSIHSLWRHRRVLLPQCAYNSGVVEFIKRFSHGLVFDGNFVWAKAMSLNGFGLNPRDWNAQREAGGQKFTWKASGTYELPFGAASNG